MPREWVALTTRPSDNAATRVSVVNVSEAHPALWWKQFNDHTLDRLIYEALDTNLDLAQAVTRLRQARASRAVSAGGLWPDVNLNGSYRRTGAGDNNGASNIPGVHTHHDDYRIGFDANWEIDIFGGIRREVEASDAAVEATIADIQDVRVSLMAEVAVNYFSLRAAQQRLAIALRNLDIQRQSVTLVRKRAKGGFVSGLDLANAEAQVATTEAQVPAFEASARNSVFDIALLLGREPSSLLEALAPLPDEDPNRVPRTPQVVGIGMPSDLLRRRPDIRAAEARLHAATANIGVAVADVFPRFSLLGTISANSNVTNRLLTWSNTAWAIGPSMSWNIFAGGRLQANIELAKARRDESWIVYERTVLTALRDAEHALTQYDFDQRRRLGLVKAVDANRRALRYAQALYDRGETDFLNLLTAQRDLLSSEDSLAATDAQIAADLATIYKAIGGGWEEPDVQAETQPAAPPAPVPAPTQPAVTQPATTLPLSVEPATRPVVPAPATQPSPATQP
jgi:NodT family efflux transporter outer membrane factor (OMF) lipoprotein